MRVNEWLLLDVAIRASTKWSRSSAIGSILTDIAQQGLHIDRAHHLITSKVGRKLRESYVLPMRGDYPVKVDDQKIAPVLIRVFDVVLEVAP